MIERSHLYQEIHEQPRVVARMLAEEKSNVNELAKTILGYGITHVVIAARGSSDNCARYAKYQLGASNQLSVALATPSLFTIYKQPPKFRDALVLGISQSGKSPDIIAVLEEAKRQGALTAVITNTPDSDLAKFGEYVINLHAGPERAVAATKTYTAEIAAIALLSVSLTKDKYMIDQLLHVPDHMSAALSKKEGIEKIANDFRNITSGVVIGRGYNYGTAFELALKLKELSYILMEPYSSADFMHGPFAMLNPGFPAIVLAPSGHMQLELLGFTKMLRERKANVILVSDHPEAKEYSPYVLTLPTSIPEWLTPFTTIIPGQLLALHMAQARGYDPDNPRAIKKITETT